VEGIDPLVVLSRLKGHMHLPTSSTLDRIAVGIPPYSHSTGVLNTNERQNSLESRIGM